MDDISYEKIDAIKTIINLQMSVQGHSKDNTQNIY